jgi:hypothetical protein
LNAGRKAGIALSSAGIERHFHIASSMSSQEPVAKDLRIEPGKKRTLLRSDIGTRAQRDGKNEIRSCKDIDRMENFRYSLPVRSIITRNLKRYSKMMSNLLINSDSDAAGYRERYVSVLKNSMLCNALTLKSSKNQKTGNAGLFALRRYAPKN